MASIAQTTFSNVPSWMKNVWISLTFVPKVWIDNIPSIDSDNGLAPTRRLAIIWTNGGYITDAYMRHLVSLS